MLSQVVVAALLPAIMAKPIAARTAAAEMNVPSAAVAHDDTPMAMMAAAMANSMGRNDTEDFESTGEAVAKIKHDALSKTQAHQQAPKPTVGMGLAGRQWDPEELEEIIASTIYGQAVSDAMSAATDAFSAAASSVRSIHIPKREVVPTQTASMSVASATSSMAAAASSSAVGGCDCISKCADEKGPPSDQHLTASQMKCISTCANECDGDDDSQKHSNLLDSLDLSSLGLGGDKEARQLHGKKVHAHLPSHEPVAAMHEEAEYEACMKDCGSHNCQSLDMGDKIAQCGDTHCEQACAGFKKGKSGMVQTKNRHGKVPVKPVAPGHFMEKKSIKSEEDFVMGAMAAAAPKPKVPEVAHAGMSEFDSCMSDCRTHNCQSLDMGDKISQCGDTKCEDSCAHYKAGYAEKHPFVKPKKPFHAVRQAVPAVPEVAEVPAAAVVPEVAAVPAVPNAAADPADPADPNTPPTPNAPVSPNRAPGSHSSVSPNLRGNSNAPVALESSNAEFDACMSDCRTHNCQSADLGGTIAQCGDTSCESACAHLKADSKGMVQGQKKPAPYHKPVGPLDAATQLAKAQSDSHKKAKPVAGFEASQEYDDCMTECKTHNCQKADLAGDISQCGDTQCKQSCKHLKAGAGAEVLA
ncbi:hypothetical protein F4819DRAFT_29596 [Hypoxylon fuscum]|nr:hypothetical protein F4819DRAFT_29596 [Hypoxylon fuscum]